MGSHYIVRIAMAASSTFPHFATLALHAGQDPEKWSSLAVVPPISLSTTFKQAGPGDYKSYEYSRSGNPTREVFEECVAAIEGAKYGMAFASGLGATTTIVNTLSSGDHILSTNDVYGGTNRLFQQIASRFGVTATFVDATDISNVEKGIRENTKVIWIESPTNPMMQIADIAAITDLAHKRDQGIVVVVDNTFASSYFQHPIELGADIVLHSVTKYMNGHSDVVMGVLVTSDDELHRKLRFLQNASGIIPSPFDCYLANRGIKTLHVRMKEHARNAMAVATFLESSPHVLKVRYPGLPSHPQHELAKRQMKGFSGMVSFDIKGGLKAATAFLKAVKVFTLAESLGGFESLCEHPAIMTHASVPESERDLLGIGDSLVRLSVGLEDTEDLIEDVRQALEKSQQ